MNQVLDFLNKLNIKESEALIVGVSFGPDSMFLLDLLKNKYKKNKIVCAHVHHNHRIESDLEAENLKKYCSQNDIIFEFMKIEEYDNNNFTESEAREKRYSFFEELIIKYNSKYLFTAHHGDDLIETILMKISRGSSIKGYSGINLISKRESYSIIRPLLYLTKEEILNYCNIKLIPYAVDKSNLDETYTRNRYRNNILPFLKKENKNIHLKFLDFSNTLNDYYNYVNKKVDITYCNSVKNNIIYINNIKDNEDFIIRKVVERFLLNNYKKEIVNINNKHILSVIKMINSCKPNQKLDLPLKKSLIKSYNKIYFDKYDNYNNYCFVIDDEVLLPNGYKIKKVDKLTSTTNYYAAFNSKEIQLPIKIRNRVIGDQIEVLNLNGTKKVKDILINEKISASERTLYPVVTDSLNNIIWLPGLKKSKYDKSKKGNYDIILEYVKEDFNETK